MTYDEAVVVSEKVQYILDNYHLLLSEFLVFQETNGKTYKAINNSKLCYRCIEVMNKNCYKIEIEHNNDILFYIYVRSSAGLTKSFNRYCIYTESMPIKNTHTKYNFETKSTEQYFMNSTLYCDNLLFNSVVLSNLRDDSLVFHARHLKTSINEIDAVLNYIKNLEGTHERNN